MPTNSLYPEMKATPRNKLAGLLADALTGVRDFADRARVPDAVPLLGGQGVGSMFLGQAPEEVNELSYGNSPIQINPYAGSTASFVPEMKRGRGAQVFDALSLLPLPGAKTVAGGLLGGFAPGVDAAATVWHGSPHKFDRFDFSKIGTGEGAQAYGHGGYVADARATGEQYQQALAHKGHSSIVQNDRNNYSVVAPDGSKIADGVLLGRAHKAKTEFDASQGGYLYKVDLPDEHINKMLDWDRPLSQQAPEVRSMVQSAFPPTYIDGRYVDPLNSQVSGRAMLDKLGMIANKRGEPGFRQAEPMLRQAGIPGIRYLDGGSRGAGAGSSNYVVFPGNEGLLTILERNGQPLK